MTASGFRTAMERRRCLLYLGVLILLALGVAGGSATGATGCYPSHSRTISENDLARVFRVSTRDEIRTYGCHLREKRRYLLSRRRQDGTDAPAKPRLAGRFVAYRWNDVRAAESFPPIELRVFDLAAGRFERAARQPDWNLYDIPDFVVNKRGHVAWTWVDTRGLKTAELMDIRVYRRDTHGEELLDQSSGDGAYTVRSRSLTIDERGRNIAWVGRRCHQGTCGDDRQTAALR